MRSARLFAAVAFSPAEKRELFSIAQSLKAHCASGRFPAPELLHITLHFFGQTDIGRIGAIEAAMKRAALGIAPFSIVTGRTGTFGRGDAAVLWLGIGEGAGELGALRQRLEKALEEEGFPWENRAFRAHITLGRDVKLNCNVGEIELPPVRLRVNGITLMESTQRSGKLEYLPLVTVQLSPEERG